MMMTMRTTTSRLAAVLPAAWGCNFGCATGHPTVVMSCSATQRTSAQINLLSSWQKDGSYKNGVHLPAEELGKKVTMLHLPALGAALTALSEEQAEGEDQEEEEEEEAQE